MDPALVLYDSILHGSGVIGAIAESVKDWRHVIRNPGGCWTAGGKYTGSDIEKLNLFLNGLGFQIRESLFGIETWRGLICEMSLTKKNVTFTRSIFNVANAVRVIYARVGDNLLTNGGGESGAWPAYNGATVTQVSGSNWRLEGSYSIRVQVPDAAQRGATIQSGISVAGNVKYQVRVPLYIVSGSWVAQVIRSDTGEAIASASSGSQTGEQVLTATVSESNAYAGAASIRLVTENVAGECFADAAVFQAMYGRAETGWSQSLISQDEHGRLERTYLNQAMTSSAANALSATKLAELAWPKTDFPDQYELPQLDASGAEEDEMVLALELCGLFGTANWRHTSTFGSAQASVHVSALVGLCEFIQAGAIESNAMIYFIDDRAPLLIGDVLKNIHEAGEATGTRWRMGVWPGSNRLDYQQEPRELRYHYRDGRLFDVSGALVHPARVEPGYLFLDDAPMAPLGAQASVDDDTRWIYITEAEFIAPEGLTFKTARERDE